MEASPSVLAVGQNCQACNGFRLCPCQVSMYEAFMQRVAQLERRMGELMTRGMDEKIRLQGRVMFNDLVDLSLFLYESHNVTTETNGPQRAGSST